MGSDGEFGPDTENIRAWLEKRASYAKDARVVGSPPSVPVTPPAPRSQPGPSALDAGRAVLAALDDHPAPEAGRAADADRPEGRTGPPAKRTDPTPSVSTPATPTQHPRTSVQAGRWTEPVENLTAHHASTNVDFPARGGGVRQVLGFLLLASLLATGGASYLAYQDATSSTIGVAGVLGLLTLLTWAALAGCTTTQLSLRHGQLIVTRGGTAERVDLLSHRAPVAIVGQPGHRRWTVLLERPGQPLLVIDASMVDPHWFTSALYRLRPDLRPGPAATGNAEDAGDGSDANADAIS